MAVPKWFIACGSMVLAVFCFSFCPLRAQKEKQIEEKAPLCRRQE
jgi:hypothetical protein